MREHERNPHDGREMQSPMPLREVPRQTPHDLLRAAIQTGKRFLASAGG
jgi:hypothetical protein